MSSPALTPRLARWRDQLGEALGADVAAAMFDAVLNAKPGMHEGRAAELLADHGIAPDVVPDAPRPTADPAPAAAPRRAIRGTKTTSGAVFWFDAIFDPRLPIGPEERLLWLYLQRRAGKRGTCWPKHVTIAAHTRLGRGRLTQRLELLEELTMIEQQRGAYGRATHYRVMPPEQWLRGAYRAAE